MCVTKLFIAYIYIDFRSSLFNRVYIFIRCINFSSWLGLACIVLFLIFTVHSYISANLNKMIIIILYYYEKTQSDLSFRTV